MTFRLLGEATIQLAAIGPDDAEHQVEKLVLRQCPRCSLTVEGTRRLDELTSITATFEVRCRLRLEQVVDAESAVSGRGTVLRQVRELFAGSALSNAQWKEPSLLDGSSAAEESPGVGATRGR